MGLAFGAALGDLFGVLSGNLPIGIAGGVGLGVIVDGTRQAKKTKDKEPDA